MFIHNVIKMNYVREGYLPNYPYHLISDEEMFAAFLNDSEECYFNIMYPCRYEELKSQYNELVDAIKYHIDSFLTGETSSIPDWVYSYMLGSTITYTSNIQDKHDLFVLMNLDNIDDEFTSAICSTCLSLSASWINKLSSTDKNHRPPTMFGEPHVIKALRLLNSDYLSS